MAALDEAGLKRLKDELAQGLKHSRPRVTPVEIEREFQRHMRVIEIYRNLRAMEAAGSKVLYRVCDVRNPEKTRAEFAELRKELGRIDGVVFGAGILEDKLLEDKTPESFDRVFGVKAEGLFNVARALETDQPKFIAVFSSIAGRYGNRGQSDYSAANDLLNKFTTTLRVQFPKTRCVALNWTAWDEVGLAYRSGVSSIMREYGLDLISPQDAARHFRDEILYGSGPVEVVIAGNLGMLETDAQTAVSPSVKPDLEGAVMLDKIVDYHRGAELVAHRTIDPRKDQWIQDHVVGGTPLLPGVLGVEMMVEAATLLVPGFHFRGIEDLRILLAVKILKGRPATLRVRARAFSSGHDFERRVQVRIESDFTGAGGVTIKDRVHYEGAVILTRSPMSPVRAKEIPRIGSAPLMRMDQLYGGGALLPHGPVFRVIEALQDVTDSGALAVVRPIEETLLFHNLNGHLLATSPLAREAGFQVAGLWAMLKRRSFALPHGCRRLEHFGAPPWGKRLLAIATARETNGSLEYDIEIAGEDGLVYDRMEGYYTVPVGSVETMDA